MLSLAQIIGLLEQLTQLDLLPWLLISCSDPSLPRDGPPHLVFALLNADIDHILTLVVNYLVCLGGAGLEVLL